MDSQELPPGLQESVGELPGADLPFVINFDSFFSFFGGFLTDLQVFLSFFSLFFMLMIIYAVIQRNRLLLAEAEKYLPYSKADIQNRSEGEEENEEVQQNVEERNITAFDQVRDHMDTDNPAEWRIAIIEADNILYKILDRAGYEGETLGEMLTNATPANFSTLESAWEAHKIRNKIAHEGQEATLDKREARRIIDLYENVFREFEYL